MGNIALLKVTNQDVSLVRTTSATVGVDRTLSPDGFIAPGVAQWVDRSGGIEIGYPKFTMSVRKPTKTSRLTKVLVKYSVPTLEITSPSTASGIQPQPTKAYDHTFVGEFLLPERGTNAERKSFLSNVLSLMITTINASDDVPTDATGTPLIAAISDLEPVY